MTVDSKNNKKLSEKYPLQNIERDNLPWIPQNPLLNNYNNITEKDKIFITRGGNATITSKNEKLTLSIDGYNQLDMQRIRHSLHKLFSMILIEAINNYKMKQLVLIPLRQYMDECKLKDVKEARIQINQDLEILFRSRVSYHDNYNDKKSPNYLDVRLITSKGIENSKIVVKLTDELCSILNNSPNNKRMLFDTRVLGISSKKNPNSYYLATKLKQHFRTNINKKNHNIISVKSLIEACPFLKYFEKKKEKSKTIIEPFYRDMEQISQIVEWSLCKSKGVELSDEELAKAARFNYFIKLYIKYKFSDEFVEKSKSSIKKMKRKPKKN